MTEHWLMKFVRRSALVAVVVCWAQAATEKCTRLSRRACRTIDLSSRINLIYSLRACSLTPDMLLLLSPGVRFSTATVYSVPS